MRATGIASTDQRYVGPLRFSRRTGGEREPESCAVSEDLVQFERPQPAMDEYDLLLMAPLSGKETIQ
jgi:hypothetical protein